MAASTSHGEMRRGSMNEPPNYEEELRIVLVGPAGTGKSAVGNTILGEKVFTSTSSGSAQPSFQKGRSQFEGQILAVVDTPHLFDTRGNQEEMKTEIAKCISFSAPGPHVFLIVLRPNRFTREEQESVKIIQEMFGKASAQYTMALFTGGDDLKEDVTIEEVINGHPSLRDFISQCGGGYHVFNNRSGDLAQVRELLQKINTMVKRNGGSCYTSKIFREAERAIKEETRQLLREIPVMEPEEARGRAQQENAFKCALQ